MLSMDPAPLRQSSSRAKVTDASRDLGCDPWSIHQPRPPYQTGALSSAGGAIYEGVAYFAMSQFLTLGAKGKTLKFGFFCNKSILWKIGHMLKPPVPKFSPSLSACLKYIAEKQVPARLKPIVGSPFYCAPSIPFNRRNKTFPHPAVKFLILNSIIKNIFL